MLTSRETKPHALDVNVRRAPASRRRTRDLFDTVERVLYDGLEQRVVLPFVADGVEVLGLSVEVDQNVVAVDEDPARIELRLRSQNAPTHRPRPRRRGACLHAWIRWGMEHGKITAFYAHVAEGTDAKSSKEVDDFVADGLLTQATSCVG